jgi:hypothetical protein
MNATTHAKDYKTSKKAVTCTFDGSSSNTTGPVGRPRPAHRCQERRGRVQGKQRPGVVV